MYIYITHSLQNEILSFSATWIDLENIIPAPQVALVVKNLPANAGDARDALSIPGSGKIPWRRKWQSSILAWKIPWTEEHGGL